MSEQLATAASATVIEQPFSEAYTPRAIIPVETVRRLIANSNVAGVESAGPPDLWCSPCRIFIREKCSAPNCAAS